MGLNELKCNNCGAILKPDGDGQLICPHCGSLYAKTEENNSYITNHNETTVNNFYGSATNTSINKKQIEGFFELLSDAFAEGYYNDAFSYCNKILQYDPTNSEALLVRRYLTEYRLSARKFFKHDVYQIIFNVIDYDFLGDKPENRRHLIRLINKLNDKLIRMSNMEILTEYNFACISSLQKYINNKNCSDSEFLELKEKTNRLYIQFGKNVLAKKEEEKQTKLKQRVGLILALAISALFCTIIYLIYAFIVESNLKKVLGIVLCVLEISVIVITAIKYKRKKI